MELTISEVYYIINQLEARKEWIKDNPDDSSIEQYELENITIALQKLKAIKLRIIMEEKDGINIP